MTRMVYGAVTLDPITGQPNGIQTDIDMSLGTAAVIAESLNGFVVTAPLGQWAKVPAEEVETALAQQKDEAMDVELRNMLNREANGN